MSSEKENKEKIELYEKYIEKIRDVNKHMITVATSVITIILIVTNVMVAYYTTITEPDPSLIIIVLVVGVVPIIVVGISMIFFVKTYQPITVEY